MKFGRNYIFDVQASDGSMISVTYPMTLEFAVRKDINPSANTGTFRLYNLDQLTRNRIYKDPIITTDNDMKLLQVRAGYGGNMPFIFYGEVKEAGSYRQEGTTNFITQVDGYDGASSRVQSTSNWTMQGPCSKNDVVNRLLSDLEKTGVHIGKVSDIPGDCPRGYVASGYTWDILAKETDNHCFIDNNVANVLDDVTTIDGSEFVISSETGLLGVPKKTDMYLTCEILFEPSLYLGQKVTVNSRSFQLYNGTYKIVELDHMGVISGAVGGKCKTIVRLWVLKRVSELAGII